jgi:hypothetical protein
VAEKLNFEKRSNPFIFFEFCLPLFSETIVIDQIEEMKFESIGLTEFPQAMPEQYKVPGDPVQAYRNFYVGEKLQFARWTRRRPAWIKGTLRLSLGVQV